VTDPAWSIRVAWKRGMDWLAAAWRGEVGRSYGWWASSFERARAHARLAADCMRADILVEYVPGHRVVTDGKIGDLASDSILCVVDGKQHAFQCRPVNVDWRGKDAIGWGYEL